MFKHGMRKLLLTAVLISIGAVAVSGCAALVGGAAGGAAGYVAGHEAGKDEHN